MTQRNLRPLASQDFTRGAHQQLVCADNVDSIPPASRFGRLANAGMPLAATVTRPLFRQKPMPRGPLKPFTYRIEGPNARG